jgi:hypothetical protein
MSTTKFIRPMSFRETIGTMYRLYLKMMIPIIILNLIVNYVTFGFGILVGIFVGPILMMASNAMLGQRVKALQSIKKGVSPGLFLKIALVSITYLLLVFIATIPFFSMTTYLVVGLYALLYLFLAPLWIFIPMIMILEKLGLRASIRRSFQILRKNFSRILMMDAFIIAICLIITWVFASIMAAGGSEPEPMYNLGISAIVAWLLASITGFNALPYVFVYYEYRARKENYTEELMTEEMGYQPIEEMMTV